MLNHLSMAYLLSNICTENYWNRTSDYCWNYRWYPFLRHSVEQL